MAWFRRALGLVIVASVLGSGAVGAVEYWDAATCDVSIRDTVEHLEEDRDRIAELRGLLEEAQRKGDAALTAQFQTSIQSFRVDGIKSKLKRLDTVDYVYCDKTQIDPDLISRADAVRPLADETEATFDAEAAPGLEIAGITSTFVPYESKAGGGCVGPFLDLAIKIQNRGGVFPRPVDMEKRLARIPTAESQSYLTINLDFDFGNGNLGYQQVVLMKGDLPNGALASGAAIDVPLRMAIASGQMHAEVTAHLEGAFLLAVNGEEPRAPVFTTALEIPIWDIYAQSTQTLSDVDPDNKSKFFAALKAIILNRGGSPTPGPVQGYFTVRHEPGGPSLAHIEGTTGVGIGPGGTGEIVGGKTVPADIKSPIMVDAQITLLCPDGSFGNLVDGNADDNARTLKER